MFTYWIAIDTTSKVNPLTAPDRVSGAIDRCEGIAEWSGAYVIESKTRKGKPASYHFHSVIRIATEDFDPLPERIMNLIAPKPWGRGRPKWKIAPLSRPYERIRYITKNDDRLRFLGLGPGKGLTRAR